MLRLIFTSPLPSIKWIPRIPVKSQYRWSMWEYAALPDFLDIWIFLSQPGVCFVGILYPIITESGTVTKCYVREAQTKKQLLIWYTGNVSFQTKMSYYASIFNTIKFLCVYTYFDSKQKEDQKLLLGKCIGVFKKKLTHKETKCLYSLLKS